MVLHGIAIAWYCMVLHGIAWYCMVCMVLHGTAWYCMVLRGIALYWIVLLCIAWYCIILHIPHICHFFTQAKFSEKKIYTEIYTVNCQFTQLIANFSR